MLSTKCCITVLLANIATLSSKRSTFFKGIFLTKWDFRGEKKKYLASFILTLRDKQIPVHRNRLIHKHTVQAKLVIIHKVFIRIYSTLSITTSSGDVAVPQCTWKQWLKQQKSSTCMDIHGILIWRQIVANWKRTPPSQYQQCTWLQEMHNKLKLSDSSLQKYRS